MSDWKVGEKHGIYEVVELTPSVAKFRLPDGSIIETPNIYQKKEGGGNAINDKPSVRKVKKDSEEDLQAQLEAARARLARAAKLKAMAG